MEVNLKREAIQYCTPVYSDTLSREETLETVVSDTLPDIARILDADAAVYLRTKTLQQGKVRIEGRYCRSGVPRSTIWRRIFCRTSWTLFLKTDISPCRQYTVFVI